MLDHGNPIDAGWRDGRSGIKERSWDASRVFLIQVHRELRKEIAHLDIQIKGQNWVQGQEDGQGGGSSQNNSQGWR